MAKSAIRKRIDVTVEWLKAENLYEAFEKTLERQRAETVEGYLKYQLKNVAAGWGPCFERIFWPFVEYWPEDMWNATCRKWEKYVRDNDLNEKYRY